MLDDLITSWNSLRAASRTMVEGASPPWPWDIGSEVYLANQRQRDTVQGRGMAFAHHWRLNEDAIAATVMGDPATYPEFHAVPKKGEAPDPKAYMASMTVMPRLIAGLAE